MWGSTKTRIWGVVKLVGGLVLMVPIYLALQWAGQQLGHVHVAAGAVLPLVLSLIGWIECILGIRFVEMARRFDTGSRWTKAWIGAVVVLLSGVYVVESLASLFPDRGSPQLPFLRWLGL